MLLGVRDAVPIAIGELGEEDLHQVVPVVGLDDLAVCILGDHSPGIGQQCAIGRNHQVRAARFRTGFRQKDGLAESGARLSASGYDGFFADTEHRVARRMPADGAFHPVGQPGELYGMLGGVLMIVRAIAGDDEYLIRAVFAFGEVGDAINRPVYRAPCLWPGCA